MPPTKVTRRTDSYLTDPTIAEESISETVVKDELLHVTYVVSSYPFGPVFYRLLIKEMAPVGIHFKITRRVDGFLKIKILRGKLSCHLSSENVAKRCCVLALLLIMIFFKDLADQRNL